MENMQPSNIGPRFVRVYNPPVVEAELPYKLIFYVSGIVAVLFGLLGVTVVVLTFKMLFDNHENITTSDWLFFGMAGVEMVWKTFTEAMALLLVLGADKEKRTLKEMANYFGISFVIGALVDVIVIAMILLILFTGSPDFNNLVRGVLLIVLTFIVLFVISFAISMMSLMKYIQDLKSYDYAPMPMQEMQEIQPGMMPYEMYQPRVQQ